VDGWAASYSRAAPLISREVVLSCLGVVLKRADRRRVTWQLWLASDNRVCVARLVGAVFIPLDHARRRGLRDDVGHRGRHPRVWDRHLLRKRVPPSLLQRRIDTQKSKVSQRSTIPQRCTWWNPETNGSSDNAPSRALTKRSFCQSAFSLAPPGSSCTCANKKKKDDASSELQGNTTPQGNTTARARAREQRDQ
jgi:hypothetical protein